MKKKKLFAAVLMFVSASFLLPKLLFGGSSEPDGPIYKDSKIETVYFIIKSNRLPKEVIHVDMSAGSLSTKLDLDQHHGEVQVKLVPKSSKEISPSSKITVKLLNRKKTKVIAKAELKISDIREFQNYFAEKKGIKFGYGVKRVHKEPKRAFISIIIEK